MSNNEQIHGAADTVPEHDCVPPLKDEIKDTLKLFGPVFLGMIATTATGVVDTIMAGYAGSVHLAGVAIGASFFWPAALFVIGLALIVQPTVAHLRGSGDFDKIPVQVWLATVVVLTASFIVAVGTSLMPLLFDLLTDADEQMMYIGRWYLISTAAGVPGFALFALMRNYWEGLGVTVPSSVFGFFALFINIPLNYIFIFGKFGAPELGGIGCGVATTATVYITVILMYFYVRQAPRFASTRIYGHTYPVSWHQIKNYLALSVPLALSTTIEMTCFSLVALFLASFGAVTVSGHTIAMNVSGVIYMIPLSLASAVAIRTGAALGAGHWQRARQAARAAIVLGLMLYAGYFSVLLAFREQIVSLYSNDPEVVNLGITLLMFCLVYLLPENIMTVASGVVRGFKDTRTIFIITLAIYWVAGLPLGALLAFGYAWPEELGAQGFWIGFISALTCGCVLYVSRIIYLFGHQKLPRTFHMTDPVMK